MGQSADKANTRAGERRAATCRHFTGLQHGTCKAGIAYSSVQDGPGCFPCLPPFKEEQKCSKVCASKVLYTTEELDNRDREINESLVRLMKAREAIVKTTNGKRGLAGRVDCPNCGGELRFTVASNGHIWGFCATSGCARWME